MSNLSSRHPIRVAARRAGLTPAALRAWERRYAAVAPERTEGGQRLYSDEQIERLTLLRRATQGGRSIHLVAQLPLDELASLVADDGLDQPGLQPDREIVRVGSAADTVEQAMGAIRDLDDQTLERLLRGATLSFGLRGVAEGVIQPLLAQVGQAWAFGSLSPAHEHMASATLRRIIGWMADVAALASPDGPCLVLATPAGERHELGAMIAGVSASSAGWRVIYLGTDLPWQELVHSARKVNARAVALSVVRHDPAHQAFVADLRDALPADMLLVLGGPGAASIQLPSNGTQRAQDLAGFHEILDAQLGPYAAAVPVKN